MNAPPFDQVEELVAEAFRDGHYRPTVVGVVRDTTGNYLLVQSAKDRDVWYFPQGGIEEGEDPTQALERELMEEIGIMSHDLVVSRILSVEDIDAPKDRTDRRGFRMGKRYVALQATFTGKTLLVHDESEVADLRWVHPAFFASHLSGVRSEKREHMLRLLKAAEGGS